MRAARVAATVAGVLLFGMSLAGATAPADTAAKPPQPSPEAAEFFEKKVRPVLVERCFTCHGPKLQQSGLRLDSRAAMLRGTDAGRVSLVPGDPLKSPLIQAVHFTGPVKMPPAGKLPQAEIDALTQWVAMGAPWPGGENVRPAAAPTELARNHWAFQPVRMPALPTVRNQAWVRSPLDRFVLAQLEARGLEPNPIADRRTLIRRASIDLTGLPPTPEAVEAFVRDRDPKAWEKLVNSLLDSPLYGERWGRYWLDIARYADTKGYVFQEDRNYPNAYTYRDWVVRALNEDLPYDQFLIQQIAADQMPLGEDRRALAAMGFLTVGRRFLNNQQDIIDDRMDVLVRGTQALGIGCARCHDHKFDPIPMKDYYSLYGVFASSFEPGDPPLIGVPERSAAYLEYERKVRALEAERDAYLDRKLAAVMKIARDRLAESLLAGAAVRRGDPVPAVADRYQLPPALVRRWLTFFNALGEGHHPVFSVWLRFSSIPTAEFGSKAAGLAALVAGGKLDSGPVNPRVAAAFVGVAPTDLPDVAARLARLLNDPRGDQQLEHALDSIGGPLNFGRPEIQQFFDRADRNAFQGIQQRVDAFKATSPAAPARAMVLNDMPNPVAPRVFLRGNPNNPGETVPRQYLAVLSGPERQPFQKGSGRAELAQAITRKDNPLTARVMANRVWMWHMGSAIVRTPSDFGLRSDPPTNPRLLDYLASRFMQDGWSLKQLHRTIMLSATYQQSSADRPAARAKDSENSLYWRANIRRLDFEAMRDSMLAVTGRLDRTQGGRPVNLFEQPFPARRTIYGFIDRQNLPGTFRVFDFASPDTHSPGRFTTTVPQQALFLMNSPFSVEQAKQLVARADVAEAPTADARVRSMYRLVYQRDPTPEETTLALRYLKSASVAGEQAESVSAWQYGYAAFDPATRKINGFRTLPHFVGGSWQGGPAMPDPTLGWVLLRAEGGHPGNNHQFAAVRRWVAPRDMTVRIEGSVQHGSEKGDGIDALVVSSSQGVLGQWTVKNASREAAVRSVQVRRGETIDFVVDCRAEPSFDAFAWAPGIKDAGGTGSWSAQVDFSGPAQKSGGLSAWERYAQALLISDEFFFID